MLPPPLIHSSLLPNISAMPTSDHSRHGSNLQHRDYPDSKLKVLRAFERRWETKGTLPFDTVVMDGMGPFSRGKIWSYLSDLGAEVQGVGDARQPDLLVVGREKVEMENIERLLKRRQGKQLRICSQEMLVAWAMTGVDPNERPQTADSFIDEHPILREIVDLLDGKWPGTEAIPSHGNGEGDFSRPDTSPLKHFGYSVGQNGENSTTRRKALRKTYTTKRKALPGEYSAEYINKWGPAESGVRLKRIADHIATTCRNFRKRSGNYDLAIEQWEADLRWLKTKYYNPLTYGFTWPETT